MKDSGDYPAKRGWQSPDASAGYRASREPSRFGRFEKEEAIIAGWLDGLADKALVLDIPCGTGRMIETVTGRGFHYVGGDFSRAMIGEARQTAAGKSVVGFVNADAARLPFRDRSADCVIIWRLLHHIGDPEIRKAMLREAARVSRGRVFVSFHNFLSFTALRKFIQRQFASKDTHGRAITHWRLIREARECGLELVETKGFRKYVSINWFACFRKH